MKFLDALEKSRNFWYLLLISFIFFLLRFPSLFEPNWYGDEGIYQILGKVIREKGILYKDIWDNKPPLLYMLYSFVDSDHFEIRLLSLIFGLASIITFYKLAQKLISSQVALKITLIFAILFGSPLLEGNIANAENFMILPTLLAALALLNIYQKKGKEYLIYGLSGFLLGLSFLFKIVAVFDFTAFLVFLIFLNKKGFKKILSFGAGFLIPIFLTSVFFFLNGAFSDFINAIFFSNIGYVGYGNRFLIPQGLLILKLAILVTILWLIYSKRKKIEYPQLFIWIWFAFSLFNAFFSQRPYTHYVLVLLPSLVLLIGFSLIKSYPRKLNALFLVAAFLLLSQTFGFWSKTLSYYPNFINFITGKEDVTSYRKFFDKRTPLDYELAAFIKANTNPKDSIFIWGNNAELYILADKLPPGRFTVAYHITSYKGNLESSAYKNNLESSAYKNAVSETQKVLDMKKPKIIIIMPYENYFPFSIAGYKERIIIQGAAVYERI